MVNYLVMRGGYSPDATSGTKYVAKSKISPAMLKKDYYQEIEMLPHKSNLIEEVVHLKTKVTTTNVVAFSSWSDDETVCGEIRDDEEVCTFVLLPGFEEVIIFPEWNTKKVKLILTRNGKATFYTVESDRKIMDRYVPVIVVSTVNETVPKIDSAWDGVVKVKEGLL